MKTFIAIVIGMVLLEIIRTIIDIIMLDYDKDYKKKEEKKDYYGRLK